MKALDMRNPRQALDRDESTKLPRAIIWQTFHDRLLVPTRTQRLNAIVSGLRRNDRSGLSHHPFG